MSTVGQDGSTLDDLDELERAQLAEYAGRQHELAAMIEANSARLEEISAKASALEDVLDRIEGC